MVSDNFSSHVVTIHVGQRLALFNNSTVIHVIGPGRGGTVIGSERNVPVHGFHLMQTNSVYTTDQFGRTVTLANSRGKVVLLGFIDPACESRCQPLGREFKLADSILGPSAARVALVGIDLSGSRRSAGFLRAYDRRNGLRAVPTWRFLTGAVSRLRRVWQAYGVVRPGQALGVSDSGVVFVIGPDGRVRARYEVGAGPGTAATQSSFAVLFADAARQALAEAKATRAMGLH